MLNNQMVYQKLREHGGFSMENPSYKSDDPPGD
jgi:hypothetical protein